MIISSPFSVRKTDRRIKYFMAWQLIYPTRCLWYLVKYDILIVSAFHTIGHLHAIWTAQVQDLARVSLFPADDFGHPAHLHDRSEEHTSELQSLMRISYAVFCLKKKNNNNNNKTEMTELIPN